jgi:hypothetical protein
VDVRPGEVSGRRQVPSSGRVDLLLGYVDLHCRAHLAYLGQRLDGREMAPVGPVYALLVELALRDCQFVHVLGVECLEIVQLQPRRRDPLHEQLLQGDGDSPPSLARNASRVCGRVSRATRASTPA